MPDGTGRQRWLGAEENLPGLDSKVVSAETVMRKELRLRDRAPVIVLDEGGITCHTIGDCVVPRQAPYALYEGRKLGLEL